MIPGTHGTIEGKYFETLDVGRIEQSRFIIQHQCVFVEKSIHQHEFYQLFATNHFANAALAKQESLGYLFIFWGTKGNIEIFVCFQIYMQESHSTNCSVTQEIGVYHRKTRILRPK